MKHVSGLHPWIIFGLQPEGISVESMPLCFLLLRRFCTNIYQVANYCTLWAQAYTNTNTVALLRRSCKCIPVNLFIVCSKCLANFFFFYLRPCVYHQTSRETGRCFSKLTCVVRGMFLLWTRQFKEASLSTKLLTARRQSDQWSERLLSFSKNHLFSTWVFHLKGSDYLPHVNLTICMD